LTVSVLGFFLLAVKIFAEGNSLSPGHDKLPTADNLKAKTKTPSDILISLATLNLPFACTEFNNYVYIIHCSAQ
jgi:hypothetical protein